MTTPKSHPLARWIDAVQHHAGRVLIAAALLIAALGLYAARHLTVDTATENMLSPQLPWRQAEAEVARRFPQLAAEMVLVIDGATLEQVDAEQRRLAQALAAQPELFSDVFAAEADPFFRRNGLLYLEPAALESLAAQLNTAQPFLGTLNRDPSLRGLSNLLLLALQRPEARGFDLTPALSGLADSVDATLAGRSQPLSWQGMIGGTALSPEPTRRFITLLPHRDFSSLLPAAKPMAAIRQLIAEGAPQAGAGLSVRITGAVALEHEELLSAFSGMALVLVLALLMVAALLYLALRSLRLMGAAVVTLIYGLIATAAFAAAAVGHLNLISIAFGVLYVGLGLDYALYLCMQYRERLGQGLSQRLALSTAAADVGGFMAVCAATTSIGFFAFIPTSFSGIAELGLISGAGMFISLIVSLTLLPALIARMPPAAASAQPPPSGEGLRARMLEWPYVHARPIWIVAALLGIGALWLAPQARFDYDPLNLRDPKSESVATFRELLRDPNIPTLTLSVLADDAASARETSQRLAAVPGVARAMSLVDFVPRDQAEKLEIIEDLGFSLDLQTVAPLPVDDAAERQALSALRSTMAGPQDPAAQRLSAELARLDVALQSADSPTQTQMFALLRRNLLGALPTQLNGLREALQAGAVSEDDLPPVLRQRWRSDDGHYRVEAWPREVLDTPAAMERFVSQVRAVEPTAVGPPLAFIEAASVVVQSFREAFLYAAIAITLLLLILLRSIADTLLVLIPLALAGLLTVATMVLLGVPFNFANVIALPLVLGVGVDYGVYLAQRGRAAASAEVNLLRTSTARAVLFGALITMANFGNLMLARHPGMVSMGLLLTVGLGMTLVCTLVLLPSLLARRYRSRDRRAV